MSEPSFVVTQDIYKASYPPISVTRCPLVSLSQKLVDDFIGSVEDNFIGVAPGYGTNCVLDAIALASRSRVLLIQYTKPKGKGKLQGKAKRRSDGQGRQLLHELLCSASYTKVAFQMDVLATSLHYDANMRISCAIDLLSVSRVQRQSFEASLNALGGVDYLKVVNVSALFKGEALAETTFQQVALQAWAALQATTLGHMPKAINNIARINTNSFDETRLSVFAKIIRDMCCLMALTPPTARNEILKEYSIKKDEVTVVSARFKTRVQGTRPVKIQSFYQGQPLQSAHCKSPRVDGRTVKLKLDKPFNPRPGSVLRVTTLGKEPLTGAEKDRIDITLKALQRTSSIADKPFFQAIWLPDETATWTTAAPFSRPVPLRFSRQLNESQQNAVAAILSSDRISVIHGPPGTGKTTVIAAVVTSLAAGAARDRPIWLVAQSNVAVKNIAEKLASVNFLKFKLIVSRDFHYDWHEHLYEQINPNLIRSDTLGPDRVATERQLLGSQVILCTLSMLSNSRLSFVTQVVPVRTIIVDEASQVEVGNYLPTISHFSHSLRKLVFIGDDKQLAPYGQGDVPALESVFEMEHLRKNSVFLDIQCMQTRLGIFIGKHVYNSKLKSVHPDKSTCCRFLDVRKSQEQKKGKSWINEGEIRAAIAEAKKCVKQGKSYRIITPYDAQRASLETALKSEKIPWEDRVFCVDSFQGNEADYIILSIVRTDKIGFLKEKRRVNVMLTRCKKGMTICTNRAFVEGAARDTLVGLLATDVGPNAWEVV
ncbi:regulator of nonsense transcripts 1 [Favolaschia claudopus]|uniref:Regulator of nonsense transcripts 1 n=1 Tax=Favolaschia claudopus TaxID=2862362 RepID=A0AAW0A2E7_9AGAR